jgi:hypothetical protein
MGKRSREDKDSRKDEGESPHDHSEVRCTGFTASCVAGR